MGKSPEVFSFSTLFCFGHSLYGTCSWRKEVASYFFSPCKMYLLAKTKCLDILIANCSTWNVVYWRFLIASVYPQHKRDIDLEVQVLLTVTHKPFNSKVSEGWGAMVAMPMQSELLFYMSGASKKKKARVSVFIIVAAMLTLSSKHSCFNVIHLVFKLCINSFPSYWQYSRKCYMWRWEHLMNRNGLEFGRNIT